MIVRELDDNSLPDLREYLERDPAPNIYALSGLLSKREGSKFFIASNNNGGEKIEGALAIRHGFKRPFAWLVTDSSESTQELTKFLNFENVSVWIKRSMKILLNMQSARCQAK